MIDYSVLEIPRQIHRIWLDEPMPKMFSVYLNAWQVLHPGWWIQDWMTSRSLPPLHNQDLFNRASEFYPNDWKRFQADIVRLELLWHYGGVYADTDIEPFRNLGPLLDERVCLVGRSPQVWRGVHSITNAFMATVPRHPFIEATIERLPESVRRRRGHPLARSAGPWHLNRVYDSGSWPDVTVLEPDELYDGTYFRHYWNNKLRKQGRGLG
jgi:mannosyltransferase OCH1-like enzyme